jgi:hypothetical protein
MTATVPAPSRPPRTRGSSVAKVVIGVSVLLILAMWVYAFLLAPSDGFYRVKDDAWRANAQQVCAAAQQERIDLADVDDGIITDPTDAQMRRRADLVDQATLIVELMLNDVVAYPVSTDRDQELLDVWEGHYRTLIDDRREYTAQLRAGVNEPFVETVVGGGPVTNVITDFTSGNNIKACAPPADVGGGGF